MTEEKPYVYYKKELCASCSRIMPIAPWGEYPECYPCKGYLVLKCGKHVALKSELTWGGGIGVDDAMLECDTCHNNEVYGSE